MPPAVTRGDLGFPGERPKLQQATADNWQMIRAFMAGIFFAMAVPRAVATCNRRRRREPLRTEAPKEEDEIDQRAQPKDNLNKMTVPELKEILKGLGASTSGIKEDLITRVLDWQPKMTAQAPTANQRSYITDLQVRKGVKADPRVWTDVQVCSREIDRLRSL